MAINGGGGKYPGIDLGPVSFQAAQCYGCDSSCRRSLWLGKRPTGGKGLMAEVIARCLVFVYQGERGAPWLAAAGGTGPALRADLVSPVGRLKEREGGALSWRGVRRGRSRPGGTSRPGGGVVAWNH
jgi:hypothetical protein